MNWCHNSMHVTGRRSEIEAFLEMLRGAEWDKFKSRGMDRGIDYVCHNFPNCKPDEETEVNNLYFDTAYGPQIPFFTEAAATFPQLRFELSFMEPLCDFAGRAVFEGGNLVQQEAGSC